MGDVSLVEQMIKKLNLLEDQRILDKTTELLRLLDLKTGRACATLGNYGKTAICIDLASNLYGIPFDTTSGLKASGLRKTIYTKYKRTFQKILDLNTSVGVSEMCSRFSRPELEKKASEIIEIYKKTVGDDLGEADLSHPQYLTMAVYQAAKLESRKINRSKIIPFSNLNFSQWCKLEEKWDRILANITNMKANKRKSDEELHFVEKKDKPFVDEPKLKLKDNEIEDYEVWKKRMILRAQLELKLTADITEDKEN